MMGIWDTVHTVLSLKDSAEAVAESSIFPHSAPTRPDPPAPFHRFPKCNICRPGGAHVWWTVVQMGSWAHPHSSKGGTNCDYLALKPPPALWPFLNEALSPHISHLGLPTISLKTLTFLFFRDHFPLFYPCYFSEQFFFLSYVHF